MTHVIIKAKNHTSSNETQSSHQIVDSHGKDDEEKVTQRRIGTNDEARGRCTNNGAEQNAITGILITTKYTNIFDLR